VATTSKPALLAESDRRTQWTGGRGRSKHFFFEHGSRNDDQMLGIRK
jgi:hypothetical protein